MSILIPEELSIFGVTSKDFAEKKNYLSKSVRDEVDSNDVIWELYNDLVKKAQNFEILQTIYWNMAIFKDKLGHDSFMFQQKSQQSRLLNLKQQGKSKVKISSTGCSASCRKLHNLVLPISKAIKHLPIPNPNCDSKLNSKKILCNSIFIVAKDSEIESKNLPPSVSDLPNLPVLVEKFEEKNFSSLFYEEILIIRTKENLMEWILSLLVFLCGFGLFFYYPLLSAILILWSIPFFPPFMKRLKELFPFFKKKWKRLVILGIGFFTIFMVLSIKSILEPKINTYTTESMIPSYQILLTEDRSSKMRSKLYVSIFTPHLINAKERAQVVIKAAKEIQASQISDVRNNQKYDYVFVVLEASKKFIGQGYVLAEAEYAPDGQGFNGLLDDRDDKWKWNVRSSNIRIDPNDINSLYKVRGTLKTFLKN